MPKVTIKDDFDLRKITDSGQCFRARELKMGTFRFITGRNILYIKKVDEESYDVSCEPQEWNSVWIPYFNLDENYADIRADIVKLGEGKPYGEYLKAATEFGAGIRILRQETFETLISFIISQRKNIPAIRKCVEQICKLSGKSVYTPQGVVSLFPKPNELAGVSVFDLANFALGYRGAYVKEAAQKVNDCIIDLRSLKDYSDQDLINELKKLRGVGDKIADCVALYAYHRTSVLPIDVWIGRAIKEDFNGENIFAQFGDKAGILQQYIFYYKRLAEKEY